MVRVPLGKVQVPGFDMSHYDGKIDFGKVKAAGYEFGIAKCTEYQVDNTFARNRAGAMAAGIIFGAYHFFHPSRDPRAQAEMFLKNANLGPENLVPMLDWESSDNVGAQADHDRAQIWLDIVEKECKKIPIIYLSPYFGQALSLPESFKRYPLMIAEYGVSAPLIPKPWSSCAFWQKSDKGNIPGIPEKDEDVDFFNGSMTNLHTLTL